MAVEVFSNDGLGVVTSGGTTAPSPGTVQTWTVSTTNAFPAASSSASPQTQFYVCDQLTANETEKILVTNISGSTWTVTRGADGTTPVAHLPGFTIVQVVARATLQVLQRPWLVRPSADTSGAADSLAFAGAFAGYSAVETVPGVTYYTNAPIQIPGGSLRGLQGDVYGSSPLTGTVIKAASGWAQGGAPQAAMIVPTGAGAQVTDLTMDLSALAGTISGLHLNGQNNGYVHDVAIVNSPHHGISDGSLAALTWRFETVYVLSPGVDGWFLGGGLSDATFIDCSVISAGQHGWYLYNQGNSKLIGCRAEFCVNKGILIDGAVSTPGLGNLQIVGFSTDRNGNEGIGIVATGNAPVIISGAMLRRDGYSGSYAAINYASARCPVLIDGLTVQPGVNDDGSGSLTPAYGIEYTPFGAGDSFLQVVNTLLWVATGGTPLQGTSPDVIRAVTTAAAAVNTQPLTYTKVSDNA